jgi:hypothetical protein
MVGRVENLAMHLHMLPLVFTQMNPPGGIIGVFALNRVPFVFAQALVIFGVDDGVFALSERYASEGVAEADAAVLERNEDKQIFNPWRDFDTQLYGNPPADEILNSKH